MTLSIVEFTMGGILMKKMNIVLAGFMLLITFGLTVLNTGLWSGSLGISWKIILLIPTFLLFGYFIYKKRWSSDEIEDEHDEKIVIDERTEFIIQKTNTSTLKTSICTLIGGDILLSVLKVNDY
jgi:hypothetical protein